MTLFFRLYVRKGWTVFRKLQEASDIIPSWEWCLIFYGFTDKSVETDLFLKVIESGLKHFYGFNVRWYARNHEPCASYRNGSRRQDRTYTRRVVQIVSFFRKVFALIENSLCNKRSLSQAIGINDFLNLINTAILSPLHQLNFTQYMR